MAWSYDSKANKTPFWQANALLAESGIGLCSISLVTPLNGKEFRRMGKKKKQHNYLKQNQPHGKTFFPHFKELIVNKITMW